MGSRAARVSAHLPAEYFTNLSIKNRPQQLGPPCTMTEATFSIPPPSAEFYMLEIRKIDRAAGAGVVIELPSLHARVELLYGYTTAATFPNDIPPCDRAAGQSENR